MIVPFLLLLQSLTASSLPYAGRLNRAVQGWEALSRPFDTPEEYHPISRKQGPKVQIASIFTPDLQRGSVIATEQNSVQSSSKSATTSSRLAIPYTSIIPSRQAHINSQLPTSILRSQGTSRPDAISQSSSSRSIQSNSTNKTALALRIENHQYSVPVYASLTARDPQNNLVMLQKDGTWSILTTDSTAPITIPEEMSSFLVGGVGASVDITMPSHFSAARLWLSEGPLSFAMVKPEDSLQTVLVEPSALANDEESRNKNWGFVEATYTDEDGLFANLSFVDFLGMAIGMVLESADRPMQSVKGPSVVAIEEICRQLSAKAAADHQPWDGLCVYDESGRAVRVLSPNSYMALHPNAFFDYWTQYINEVWTRFEQPGKELSIDTQGQAGIVRCSVKLGVLICDGDNRSYQRPSAQDIFGCSSGPFAVLPGDNAVHDAVAPRLCAAVQRTTLLLPLGDTQPYEDYSDFYGTSPTNWYSSFVHAALSDARGYTFPYDDVAPSNGSDLAGIITSIDPEKWIITLGADSSVVSGNMTH